LLLYLFVLGTSVN